jgi:hypothetical protein
MGASHWVLLAFALLGFTSAGIFFGFVKGVNWAAENMTEAPREVTDDEILEAFGKDDDDEGELKN